MPKLILRVRKFDPLEPRGPDGEWIRGLGELEHHTERPSISHEQLSALMPKHGGWTTSRRAQTLAALKTSEEGRSLTKTVDSFQSGGSTAIPRLRTDIEKTLSGAEVDAGRKHNIDVLLGSIAASDATDKALYRGMSIPGLMEDVKASYKDGTPINISLGSFSTDKALARDFTERGAGQRVRAKQTVGVLVNWLDGPKKALPIENFGKSRIFGQEREWVSSGKFRVVGEPTVRSGVLTINVVQEGML